MGSCRRRPVWCGSCYFFGNVFLPNLAVCFAELDGCSCIEPWTFFFMSELRSHAGWSWTFPVVPWGPLGPSWGPRVRRGPQNAFQGSFYDFLFFLSFGLKRFVRAARSKDHSRKQNIHNKLYNLYNVACCMLPFQHVCVLSLVDRPERS